MANRKKEVYKPKPMTEGKRNVIQGLHREYDIQTAEDIQDVLKDLLSGTLKEMLEVEMDDHLGYAGMNVPTSLIIATGQSPSASAANTVSLRWICRRTGRVPSSLSYCQSAGKTFQPLMTRLFPCTPRG